MRLAAIFVLCATLVQASTSAPRPAAQFHVYRVRRHIEFKNISCAIDAAPEARSTPDPFLNGPGEIVVNFILTSDGTPTSVLILVSKDPRADREAVRALRTWRFRPALCNTIPTASEGIVIFY